MSVAEDFLKFKKRKESAAAYLQFRNKSLQGAQGIIGPQGIQGEKGDKGDKGDDGRSVNPQEVVNYLLTNPLFLDKIKGKDGADGITNLIQTEIVKAVDDEALEKKISEYFHTPEFKALVASKATILGGGLGIAPSRVTNLETRVTDLENNPSGGLQYLSLTSIGVTTYTSTDFIFGTNIIGVNAPGQVTIQLPDSLTAGTIVTIKDESLSALTNNITVTTYKES